jgi:hypothetical protein
MRVGPPEPGEMVYGCQHPTACGTVAKIIRPVTEGGFDHYIVREQFHDREIRVKRQGNHGFLYEVELVWSHEG